MNTVARYLLYTTAVSASFSLALLSLVYGLGVYPENWVWLIGGTISSMFFYSLAKLILE